MVSINVFSTLWKIIIPRNNIDNEKIEVYIIPNQSKEPAPVKAYLKEFIIGVIGFKDKYGFKTLGTLEEGYIIGEAYINKVIKTPINWLRSRYLTDKEEMINPNPNDRIAINKTRIGKEKTKIFILTKPWFW